MCGIAGLFSFERFKKNHDIKNLVKTLLLDIKTRGGDATGLSLINSEKNEIVVLKSNIDVEEFIRKKEFNKLFKDIENYNIVLLHTRKATHGVASENVNNHPHYDKINNNVLIHNGIISNYEELKTKFKDLKLSGECDSEIILSLFNKKKYDLKTTLKLLEGSMAISLYHDKKMYLYAYNNPLNLCFNKTKNLYLFSSHDDIFNDIFSKKTEEFNHMFKFYKSKDEYSIYKLEDEDYLNINFKNKTFKKSFAVIKEYEYKNYSSNWNNITYIKPKDDIKTFKTEDIKPIQIIKDCDITEEFLKKDYEENKDFNDLTEVLTDEEYLTALDEEKNERIAYNNYKNPNVINYEDSFY